MAPQLLPHAPPLAELSPVVTAMLLLVPITLVSMYYAHRARTLSWDERPVPGWRQACFWSGMALMVFILFEPWGYTTEDLVIAHMIEHLLIADIASLLIVLGLTRSLLQPVLAVRFVGKLQFLCLPYVALPVWALNFYVWHVPVLYDAAYGGSLVHGLEHASFLFFGCVMWMPVFGSLPMPTWFGPGWKIVYTVVVRFAAAVLGNVLMWTGTPLYDRYAAGEASFGLTPVSDQSTAGVIMMVEGTFLIMGVLAWTFFESASRSMRKQELLDLAFREGVDLSEDRAELAVRAGHGDLLEKRILAQGGGDGGA